MTLRRLFSAIVLTAMIATPVLAAKPFWHGKPDWTPGEHKGYFLWKDEDGWHLRWTTKNRKHEFSGSIVCDGSFKSVHARSKDDKKDKIKRVGRNRIEFRTRVQGGRDGVDFRLSSDTAAVTFDLRMDGQRVEVNRVKIGRNKRFPGGVPFTLER